jgi:hypothetical protein
MGRETKRDDERNPHRGRASDDSLRDVAPDPLPAAGERGFEEEDRRPDEPGRGDEGSPTGPTDDRSGSRRAEDRRERP